jgi:hypothetical protein
MNSPDISINHTSICEISLDDDNILRVTVLKEGEMDLDEVKKCFEVYRSLGCDRKKALQLLDFTVPAIITKEARDYVDLMAPDFFIASAVVTQSLPVRIIVNFCMRFFNPAVPLKMFVNEEDARTWLKTQEKKSFSRN